MPARQKQPKQGTSDGSTGAGDPVSADVGTPWIRAWVNVLGVLLLLEVLFVAYLLLAVWPDMAKVPAVAVPIPTSTTTTTPSSTTTSSAAQPTPGTTVPVISQRAASGQTTPSNDLPNVALLGSTWHHPDPDLLYLVVVLAMGALGSSVHAMTSYSTYKGNRTLYPRWAWWYLMRLPSGAAIALVFYIVIRAGFLSAGTSTGSISPFGVAAVAALSGLFSKQAIDKLREMFDTLFRVQGGDSLRADKVEGALVVSGISPDRLPVESVNLVARLEGKGFFEGMAATVNGASRQVKVISPTQAEISLLADDVSKPGVLAVEVTAPGPASPPVGPFKLRVHPRVDSLAYRGTDAAGKPLLIVQGAGFVAASSVNVDGVKSTVVSRSPLSLSTSFDPAPPPDGTLVVINPDPDGGASNPMPLPPPP